MESNQISELIKNEFEEATLYVRNKSATFDKKLLLYFYARYKQANEGICTLPKPGFFDFQGKEKWTAWKSLNKLSKEESMKQYISKLDECQPEWKLQKDKMKESLGFAVSKMINEEEEIKKEDRSTFDICKEGDLEALKQKIKDINEKDDNGMTLLHWACDRGDLRIVSFLLQQEGIVIDVQDFDFQTPLHYASSCDHGEVVELLLERGAKRTLQDSEGFTAQELASSQKILSLFNSITQN